MTDQPTTETPAWPVPGESVAMVTTDYDGEMMALRLSRCWLTTSTERYYDDLDVTAVRPVLVLDPDNAEQMQALVGAIHEQPRQKDFDVRLTDAVRSLLPTATLPKPSKPNEPVVAGARVIDVNGVEWMRLFDGRAATGRCWAPLGSVGNRDTWRLWFDLDVIAEEMPL